LLSNWRWVHTAKGYTNCFNGGDWNKDLCPDEDTCVQNCVVEGIAQPQWASSYGVTFPTPTSVNLNFITNGNVGSRLLLLDPSGDSYQGFNLLNKEFSFTVDASKLDCGLNGALYFVSMDLNNPYPEEAGPAYGMFIPILFNLSLFYTF